MNRKRKTASPIKAGQDYSYILRCQEISASPALKKSKEAERCVRDEEGEEEGDVGNPRTNKNVTEKKKSGEVCEIQRRIFRDIVEVVVSFIIILLALDLVKHTQKNPVAGDFL